MNRTRRIAEARSIARLLIVFSALTASCPAIAEAAGPVPREKTEARISRALRAWSDSEWTAVAGERVSESYEVARGDTLWGISQRLFNDAQYWPKIWALNNGRILNAHRIAPGMKIAFAPGTSTTPPALDPQPVPATDGALAAGPGIGAESGSPRPAAAADAVTSTAAAPGRSEEWKKLGPQRWESTAIELPPTVDRFGFDASTKGMKLREWPARGIEIEALPYTEKLESLGRIIGARHESSMLGFGDLVYIEPETELQVGETYTVTSEPALLKARGSDRNGWSYSVDGTVRILGVKDGTFLGRIESARNGIFRGSEITQLAPKVRVPAPIPGPGPITGVLYLDPRDSTFNTGQFKQVFIDRGTEDGIEAGMVFRAYEHEDPATGREVFENDTVINGDILVLKTSSQVSMGIVLGNVSPIPEDSHLVLLTDISDVMTKAGFRPRTPEEIARDKELDDLENVPPTDGLTPDEQKELNQLEKWKGNPPAVEEALEGQDLRKLSPGVDTPDAPPEAPTDATAEPTDETAPPPSLDEAAPPPAEDELPPPAVDEETPPPAESEAAPEEALPPPPEADEALPPAPDAPPEELPQPATTDAEPPEELPPPAE